MEEKISFRATDGTRLTGILSKPAADTNRCIILCHGLTVTKEEDGVFTELAKKLSEAGLAVFRFDFRGHGESAGRPEEMTIAGEVLDIDAAVKFLQYRGYSEFGIVAASFAGGPVSNYASEAPTFFKAVVMWNALVDYDAILNPKLAWPKRYFNKAAMKKLAKNGFLELGRSRKFRIGKALVVEMMMLKPWKDLQKVACPILFIHGDKDTYVPYKDSVKYSKKMDNARLVTIKGAEHGFHDKKEESEQADSATVTFFLENMR